MTKRRSHKSSPDDRVIIVGGGLAGLTTAALLAEAGIETLCIDREPPPVTLQEHFDGRTTAISWGSRQVLEAAGIWPMMDKVSCPIRQIDILDGDSPVLLTFNSNEVNNRTFGWIAENIAIRQALYKRISQLKNCTHIAPATVTSLETTDDNITVKLTDGRSYTGALVIGADGRMSSIRQMAGIEARSWSYHQRAVVCTVEHENPHNNVAVEHFHPDGPFAVLPMTDSTDGWPRSSVVWTEHGPEKDSALHWSDEAFNAGLTARFPDNYGQVRLIGRRFCYPLGFIHAHNYIAPRIALVADAAHGIHPIAGQGLNLGFRDIAEIFTLLENAANNGEDLGSEALLNNYQAGRRVDNMGMAAVTDGLTRLFSNDVTLLRSARRIGLQAVAKLPMAKKFFMGQAMGAAGILPEMIREAQS